MKYAQIISDAVHGVFEYDPLPEFAPNIVMIPLDENSPVQEGWLYDGTTFTEPPVIELPQSPQTSIVTKLAFRQRMTMAEKAMIELACIDNPSAAAQVRQNSATLRAYMGDVASSTFIDLARPETIGGVQALEAMGLIGPGRAATILDVTTITSYETPR